MIQCRRAGPLNLGVRRLRGYGTIEATMSSKAKATFNANIQRASYFLDIHEAMQTGRGAPDNPRRELPRGAVVFAVGAIDAYLSEVSAEVMVHQLSQNLSSQEFRDLLKKINQDVPTLALEVAVLSSQKERQQRIREAIADHFYNRVSNHGANAVASAVQRIGGKPADLWSALISNGHADPQGRLNHWTDVRHRIVHQGAKPQVTRPAAREFIAFTRALVDEIDKVASRALQ